MLSELEIINPLNYPAWDELVLSAKNYSFFHSSNWARVLHESYGYRPLYFAQIKNEKLNILIPFMEVKSIITGKRVVSLPFSDYCEPTVNETDSFKEFFDHIIKYGREAGWQSIEIRDGNNFPKETQFTSYYSHTLELSENTGQIFSGFRDSVKRNIRKGCREGVEVGISNSPESIRKFYRLNCSTRRRHGLPPQPYYFFDRVYKHIISQDHGFAALASFNKNVIAGAVFFHFGDKAIYKYGASDENYRNLRPNDLIIRKAIKWYCERGYKSLSFGRTDTDNDGLRRFKKGWGTVEAIIKYYKYDVVKGVFVQKSPRLSHVREKILRKLPRILLRTTGSFLYRHIG